MEIKITLIEDHPEYRQTLRRVIGDQSGMQLSWCFGTAEAALRKFGEKDGSVNSDLLLLDLGLPGIGGLEALTEILALVPDIKVIVLTQSGRESDVLSAIALGAQGYLLKSASAEQIIDAITNVFAGGVTTDPQVANFIVEALRRDAGLIAQLDSPLSERETQVLELLAEGKLRKEVAAELDVSETTVVYHINNIYQKLQVHNAPGAVAKAFGLGILPSKKPDSK